MQTKAWMISDDNGVETAQNWEVMGYVASTQGLLGEFSSAEEENIFSQYVCLLHSLHPPVFVECLKTRLLGTGDRTQRVKVFATKHDSKMT